MKIEIFVSPANRKQNPYGMTKKQEMLLNNCFDR